MKLRFCVLLLSFFTLPALFAQADQSASTPQDPAATSVNKKAEALRAHNQAMQNDPDYAETMELYDQHRDLDALPRLEKLIVKYPSNPAVMERLASCLIVTEHEVKDVEARKQQRARARKLLVQAQELGADDSLLLYYLRTIPEGGGSDTVFSNRKEVDESMREGEALFGRRDYKGAINAYTRAMLFNPNLYSAVLFIGDSYFADKQYVGAGEWFLRATQLDPNRETAYRYWGDALMRLGKTDEARSKFIEAIIAEPYNPQSFVGLKQWAALNKLQIAPPAISVPQRPAVSGKNDGQVNIVLDANSLNSVNKKDGTSAWMMYQIIAGAWQAKLFKEKFPGEKQYRHSLSEEDAALGVVAASVEGDLKKGKLKQKDLDTGIAQLVKLHEAKLLEPYILLNRADEGIAQDYVPYRDKNRDKLRQYLDEFVAPKPPKN